MTAGFIKRNEDGTSTISNPFIKYVWRIFHGYSHEKYWKWREIVTNPQNKASKIRKLILLILLKRNDIKHHSSFGIDLNRGAFFKSPPRLPHGPYGIIVGMDCIIGHNAVIYHQVTIMDGNVIIGDNVLLGAGAKVLPNVTIGNNVKVGANCVVVENIPDNSTVVLTKPRLINEK